MKNLILILALAVALGWGTTALAIQPSIIGAISSGVPAAGGGACTATLTGSSYSSKSVSVGSIDSVPRGIAWVDDGNSILYLGDTNDDVYQLDCTTPYEINTCSDSTNSFSANEQYASTTSAEVDAKNDMTVVWVMESTGGNIDQYACTTGDVSTCSYDSKTLSTAADATGDPWGFDVSEDGDKLYVVFDNDASSTVVEYDCSTAYDISSCSTNTNTAAVQAAEINPRDVTLSPSGDNMFIVGFTEDDIDEHDMTTSFDASTASFDQELDVSTEDGIAVSVAVAKDCSNFHVLGFSSDTIYQYE